MARLRTDIYPKNFAVLALASSLLFTAGCKKTEETVAPAVYVQAVHPEHSSIAEQITADATLAPLAQAAIAPKVTAPVKKFYVQRGSKVKAGELLATLENSDLAAAELDSKGAYTAAQATYDTATRAIAPEDYTRAQLDLAEAKAALDLNQSIVKSRSQLLAQGAIPGRDLDTAKAALVQARATYDLAKQHLEAVEQVSRKAALENAQGQLSSAKGKYLGAQAQLSYTEIRSPIDGGDACNHRDGYLCITGEVTHRTDAGTAAHGWCARHGYNSGCTGTGAREGRLDQSGARPRQHNGRSVAAGGKSQG
jgi:HlyD family secretion protein